MKKILIIIIGCVFICGCATTHSRGTKGATELRKTVKDLSDEDALEIGALIYNVRPENKKDEIARNLTIGEYMIEMKARRSEVVISSGILELEYEPIPLRKWKNEELGELYTSLQYGTGSYSHRPEHALRSRENALRIIRLTALDLTQAEMDRRESAWQGWAIFGHVLGVALSVFAAVI
ncbi:MAG: hypothetical protein HQ594_01415 [Candidatus Omnitrophica bacterium]|nr:hypothetical protein [Candidatus Omnitrophota bacterium]